MWFSTVAGVGEAYEDAANCLWLLTNSKPCANCKSPIQKNEGCNHMQCAKVQTKTRYSLVAFCCIHAFLIYFLASHPGLFPSSFIEINLRSVSLQCKYDFCWICLEEWKKHSSSTGGYYRCTRYEVIQQLEEQSKEMTAEVPSQ